MTTTELEAKMIYANYIAGEWRPSRAGGTYERHDPMRPQSVVGIFPASDADDVEAAVGAAEAALDEWSSTPAPRRGDLLVQTATVIDARAADMARCMTAEMGKPIRESLGEVRRAAAVLRYFGGEGLRAVGEVYDQSGTSGTVFTRRRPVGVVGLITPWNFPIAIPTWKTAPALVFGNTVVLKLALDAPATGLALAECFDAAGLPPGVLNVITGPGATAGEALVRDARVEAISFTGSVTVGHAVRDLAVALGKRVQLELGGQSPLVVLADADLGRAVEAAYAGAFWSAGQKCTATRRIFVERGVYDDFKRALLARIERGKVGDPMMNDTEVGPVVNEKQYEEIRAAIARGRDEGGTVLAGGEDGDTEGFMIEPTLFEGLSDDAQLSREEVFGPVTALYPVSDLDEAIARANAVEFGLAASIYTNDVQAVDTFTRKAQAGILHVNSATAGAEVHVPFGGVKNSGWGPHEQGRAAMEFFTELVTIYHDS